MGFWFHCLEVRALFFYLSIEEYAQKKIKRDVVKQIKIFEKFSYNVKKKEDYWTISEEECLEKAVNYYFFLKLI